MTDAQRVQRELGHAVRQFTRIAARDDDDRVVWVDGLADIYRTRDELTDRCQSRLRAIHSKPPSMRMESLSERVKDVAELSDRGVVQQSLSPPGRLESGGATSSYVDAIVAAGDDLRTAEDLPLPTMLSYDQLGALMPMPGVPSAAAALLVRDPVLLQPVNRAFDATWRRSTQFGPQIPEQRTALDVSPRQHEILALLGSGAGDDAIARRLGVTDRTVRREIARLCRAFDIETRFQLGAEAARRGLL